MESDFLNELIAERTARNPGFAQVFEDAWQERLATRAKTTRRSRPILVRKPVANNHMVAATYAHGLPVRPWKRRALTRRNGPEGATYVPRKQGHG